MDRPITTNRVVSFFVLLAAGLLADAVFLPSTVYAEWSYQYLDNFDTNKAQTDSYDHSIFWPEEAFPPPKPYLYYGTKLGSPPRGLVFMDYTGVWAHLNYCFPVEKPAPEKPITGIAEFDLLFAPGEMDAYFAYSISPDGKVWTIPTPLKPGHHVIPVGSSEGTCYIGFLGTKALLDNLEVYLNSPSAHIQVPRDYKTIQDAIDAASNGQIVEVAPGIYTGTGNRDIDFRGKKIVVRSIAGPEKTIILCNGDLLPPEPHRGFYFHSGEGPLSVLRGFTIDNGFIPGSEIAGFEGDIPWPAGPKNPIGAGIYCEMSGPTIINCIVKNCRTELGAGIGCVASEATILNCRVRDCFAGGFGDSRSGGRGAGVGIIKKSNVELAETVITNNSGYYNSCGGGLYCLESAARLAMCTISDNIPRGNLAGGGIYCGRGAAVNARNCVISGNAAQAGAGVYAQGLPDIINCSLTITNCTIAYNRLDFIMPPSPGAAIHSDRADIKIKNSIIWYNAKPQIVLIEPPCESPVVYSDVQGGWPGAGNIDMEPLFAPQVWPAAGYDFHLCSIGGRYDPKTGQWVHDRLQSPCIDAGDPSDAVGNEPIPNGHRINMGAYGGTWQASKSIGPWPEPVILFSTEKPFTATAGPHAGQLISAGDLLDTAGRIVARNTYLTRNFMPEPPTPDYGLDAVHPAPSGGVHFSLEESFWDERLGTLAGHGDLLCESGRILLTNAQLMRNFHPMPVAPDYGLDAVFELPDDDVAFSIEEGFFDEFLGKTIGHGDMLSTDGKVLKTNAQLLRGFHPMPSPVPYDYGLDAVHILDSGEIWFSIEEDFWDEVQGRMITGGDILSDRGVVVKTNRQLLAAFFAGADKVPENYGLDALWIGPGCTAALRADLNGDCRVDLLDFVILAEEWLECNLVPRELCVD